MRLSCASGYIIPAVVSAVSHTLKAGILQLGSSLLKASFNNS